MVIVDSVLSSLPQASKLLEPPQGQVQVTNYCRNGRSSAGLLRKLPFLRKGSELIPQAVNWWTRSCREITGIVQHCCFHAYKNMIKRYFRQLCDYSGFPIKHLQCIVSDANNAFNDTLFDWLSVTTWHIPTLLDLLWSSPPPPPPPRE